MKIDRTIPIISLWQPWASLVVFGEKKIETRGWKWPGDLPSFLAIHAAKKWDRQLAAMTKEPPFSSALALHGHDAASISKVHGVVGVVRIVECVSTSMLPVPVRESRGFAGVQSLASKYLGEFKNERAFGDYSYGRYAWVFDRCISITPIPLKGHQSLWKWEPTPELVEWMEREP